MSIQCDLAEFRQKFLDERTCIDFLEKSRWPSGDIVSPFTGKAAYRITTRPGIYKCKETRKSFSVRVGTIFEESRLPLLKWFEAIFLIHLLKGKSSSIQLANIVGVTQKTAWFMLSRIRYAIQHQNFTAPLTLEIATSRSESQRLYR